MAETRENITIVGGGIVGLWQAYTLARRGHSVRLVEASETPFAKSASRWAGALIAPDCESEGHPAYLRDWGHEGLKLWRDVYPGLLVRGTLVVAQPRDHAELTRFARDTHGHQMVEGDNLAALEPHVAERFPSALFYPNEAHMNATHALHWLLGQLSLLAVDVTFGSEWADTDDRSSIVVDCRGFAARRDVAGLRGVRGERLTVTAKDVTLSRPLRLLHPRQSIYIVPQGGNGYVIGATVIEREDDGPMTVKSALELLAAAYTAHPGFSEAAIVDLGAGVRPAFADNVPRVVINDDGRMLRVNGAYRHGFLLAPVLAEAVADYLGTGTRHAVMHHA